VTELQEHPSPAGSAPFVAAGADGVLAPSGLTVAVDAQRHWVRSALFRGRGLVGLILVGLVVLVGVLAPLLAPFDPNEQLAGANLLGPSATHLLGTDQVNRDVFSRVLYGIRIDLLIVFVAVPLGAAIGGLFAALGSLFTATDVALQRTFDVVLAFPSLILAIGVTAVAGPGAGTIILVITVVEIPIFGRMLRSGILTVRELPFVEAADTLGASRWTVLRRHVLPNAAEPLWVQLALSLSTAVFVESAMSFLGIGVRPPDPSLGSIVNDAVNYLDINPAFALGPLAVIVVLVLGFQLLAQGIGAARRV
jgi:peptide/nickel transport system permease protein